MIREDTLRQMQRDELLDKGFFYDVLTVREFARLIRVAPQLVYYRVRNGKIKLYTCNECGREGLVNVNDAIGTFRTTPKDVQEAAEAHRQDMGAGDTKD